MPDNLLEGAEELLVDATSALNVACVQDYIVIGGWCPYLRKKSRIRHPGTLDVDILFKDGERKGSLRPAIDALRENGFILSAKHPFQLLIEKVIRGERLIYNVDLLHPNMNETNAAMFVDHLDLDVPLDSEERRVKTLSSIVLPNSAILFQENLSSKFTVHDVTFNLVDFTGMFITKMDSCRKPKRERDAFDLYVALKNDGIDFSTIAHLRSANPRVDKSLNALSAYLKESGAIFDANVAQFAQESMSSEESPSSALERAIHSNEPEHQKNP